MRKFIGKICLFFVPAGLLYVAFSWFLLPDILSHYYGPNIEQQLRTSFANAKQRQYEMVVLGNSRLYCGANPDEFEIPTFNFSHNNDSYNQLYFKLKWLLDQGKEIKHVVLGIDYFQFGVFADTRNYIYGELLPREYLQDYRPRNYQLAYYVDLLRPEKLQNLLLRPVYRHELKDNGQFLRKGRASADDFIKREPKRLPVQVQYFEKILQLCSQHNIVVFICMPPLRQEEYRQYTRSQTEDFHSFVQPHLGCRVRFIDFSTAPGFSMSDFVDISHLNEEGASRFSRMLSDSIVTYLPKISVCHD